MNTKPLSIGIIGLGAIGCLISSQLPSSASIYVLPRKTQQKPNSFQTDLAQSASFQITFDNDTEKFSYPIWNGQPLDIIIICCKANQCLDAVNQWHSAISSQTQLVLLQNGMGQHELIANLYPENAVFAASTTEGAFRKSNQDVIHAGKGVTQWGSFHGKQTFKLPLSLLKGEHLWQEDIKQFLVDKLAINCVINPLTVKHQCKNGELLLDPIILDELKALSLEITNAFKNLGLSLSFELYQRAVQVCETTANNYSSMLQDIKNSSLTEIDFINGYLINKAKENHFDMPISESLVKIIKEYGVSNESC